MVPLRSPFSDIPAFHGAKGVSTSQGKLIERFNRIGYFFRRLENHTGVSPTTAMTDITVEVTMKAITILGIATNEIRCVQVSELISRRFYDLVATGLRSTQPQQRNISGLRVVLLLLKHLPVHVRALWSYRTPLFSAAQRSQTEIAVQTSILRRMATLRCTWRQYLDRSNQIHAITI